MDNLSDCVVLYNTTTPSKLAGFTTAVKACVGITCLLSFLGASLIIFTYVAFKDLRTTARQILVNLSVADILVVTSHFLGLFTNYDRFLYVDPEVATQDVWCSIQAAVDLFGSISVCLWTTALAAHLVSVVVFERLVGRKVLAVIYLVCWGVPAAFTIVFGAAHLYGFTHVEDVGWCYSTGGDSIRSTAAGVLGYTVWSYFVFLVLPVLYTIAQVNLCKLRYRENHTVWQKLLLVPLIFILLRLYSAIIEIPVFYLHGEDECHFRMSLASAALTFLAGIGDSAQGLANGVLFCLMTRSVRIRLAALICIPHVWWRQRHYTHLQDTEAATTATVESNTGDRLVESDVYTSLH